MAGKPTPIEHGTLSGYKKHVNRKDVKCQPCWDARAAHMREERAKKRKPKLTPEQLKENKKQRYQRDKEQILAKNKEYYLANKAKIQECNRLRNKANRQKVRDYARQYYQKNKQHIRNNVKRRRHKRHGVLSIPYSVEQVLSTYGTNCHICKDPVDLTISRKPGIDGWEKALHIDHVIPMSRGGPDILENVKPSHAECNLIKSAKFPGYQVLQD
jgi:hypothetical protein